MGEPRNIERLQSAWELKFNHRFQEAMRLLSDIKQDLSIPPGQLDSAQVKSLMAGPEARSIMEALLLDVSLARSAGNPSYAKVLLNTVSEEVQRIGLNDLGFLAYEKGIQYYGQGDFYSAMECFSRWAHLTDHPLHRLSATGNIVFCLENLGMDYQDVLREAEAMIAKLDKKHDLSRIKSQIETLYVRQAFRAGNIEEALSLSKPKGERLFQTHYQYYWLSQLPYHRGYRPISEEESGKLLASAEYNYAGYRLRTLLGFLHPADLSMEKASEPADRLYLWVWKWLISSSILPFSRIAPLLESLQLSDLAHRFAAEDSQLMRNALLWLGLFDPISEERLSVGLSRLHLPPENRESPLLHFEHLVIRYFMALRDDKEALAQEYRRSLEANALWGSSQLRFREIVERKGFYELSEKLEALTASKAESEVFVDMARSQVFVGGACLNSESLCRSISLLHQQSGVSFETFVLVCFGLRRYDPVIHDPKIYNLLTRLRRTLPDHLRVRVKNGTILREGDWNCVTVKNTVESPGLLRWLPLGAEISDGARAIAPHWNGALSRRQIETLINRPRSTTNRLIAGWLREKRVQRVGAGKNVTYLVQGESP